MGTRTEIGGKTESTNRNAAAGFESFLPNIMTTGAATNRNTQKFGAMKTAIVNAIHALHRFAKSLLGQYNWATGWASFVAFLTQKLHSSVLGNGISDITNFAVTFLVAMLSYKLFEVRFLRLKRRFEYDSEAAEHRHAYFGE